jgi:ribosomal protein S18 acetylase RimI-like enzyme
MSAGVPAGALAPELQAALVKLDRGLGLRAETEDDLDFLIALYTSTRWEELAPAPWPDAAKHAFLAEQARLQHAHYLQHYAGAEMLLITAPLAAVSIDSSGENGLWLDPAAPDRALIGRIYLRAGASEIRLMEIALLPAERGAGIGQCLVAALQHLAQARSLDLTLHVEPNNPAQRLYQRLGFSLIEQRGIYDFLGWTPRSHT